MTTTLGLRADANNHAQRIMLDLNDQAAAAAIVACHVSRHRNVIDLSQNR
ncbi:MAG: hypothetical protein AAF590_04860 [Pseudomonadota bacterium]